MNDVKTEKNSKKNVMILILALVILALLALVLWLALGRGGGETASAGSGSGSLIAYDDAAQSGHLPGKTEEEIQAELNQIVEEGMFNISIAANVVFPDGADEGTVNIENIEANHYNMQVTITLDDTGEAVYESGALKPGQYIEKVQLLRDLPAGTYNATATFTALSQDSLAQVGQAAAKIALVVEA